MSKKFNVFKFVFAASLLLLTFVATFFALQNVNADSSITLEDGAEIRTTGKKGIRFIANANDLTGYIEFGFVCAKGTYSLSEMTDAFNAAEWYNMEDLTTNTFTYKSGSSNGINMIRSYQSNLESGSKEIKLTIFGIDEANYITDLSVFAYGVVDGETVFSDINVTRNIAEVALQSSVYGKTSSLIDEITDYAKTNYKKVGYDLEGNFIVNGFNRFTSDEVSKLEEMFIEDYNEFTGSSLTLDSTYYAFVSDLTGANTTSDLHPEDITGTNVYKFFNDPMMKAKWGWMIDYVAENDKVHPGNQAKEILSDGKYKENENTYKLYGACHVSSCVYAILNGENCTKTPGKNPSNIAQTLGEYNVGIVGDFTNISNYNKLATYCNFVYFDNVELVQIGDSIELPEGEAPIGYEFISWSDGNEDFSANAKYTVETEDVKFTVVTEAIKYEIQLYNGDELYKTITYTVEEEVSLPKLNDQDGRAFGGWCDNPELSDEPITTIAKGSTEDKVYFAKWSLKDDTIIVDDDYSGMENGAKVEVEGESEEYIVGTNAFATIKEGLEVANENATIIVAAGNYADALSITKPVTIIGANKELVLDHNDTHSVSAENDSIISASVRIENGANDVTIKGFVATNQIGLFGNENVNISHVYFNTPTNGLGLNGAVNVSTASSNLYLDHIYYIGTLTRLVHILANIENFSFTNSVVMDNVKNLYDIIRVTDAGVLKGNLVVENNYFQKCVQGAIYINNIGKTDVLVKGNIFKSAYCGIYFRTETETGINYNIQYNIFEDCGYSGWYPIRMYATKLSATKIEYNKFINSKEPESSNIIYLGVKNLNADASNNYFSPAATESSFKNISGFGTYATEEECGPDAAK